MTTFFRHPSTLHHDSLKSSAYYLGGSDATCLVPSPGPLAASLQLLNSPTSTPEKLSDTLSMLASLSADAVNCWYLQQAGVVHAVCTLLQHRRLDELPTHNACRILAGQARNCNMLELARCNAAATLVMLLHGDEDDEDVAIASDAEDECCGVSARVATTIASTLADMAYEQLGKRLVVQAGGIQPLLRLASLSPNEACRTAALLALRRLASDTPCAEVMLQTGARDQVLDIVAGTASRECKEGALSLLNSLEKQDGLLRSA